MIELNKDYELVIRKRAAYIREAGTEEFKVAPGRPYGRVQRDCMDQSNVRLLLADGSLVVVPLERFHPWRIRFTLELGKGLVYKMVRAKLDD